MNTKQRLLVLLALLILGSGVSTWINLPPWLTRQRAAQHYRAGLEAERSGKMDGALAEWRMAADMDRDYPEPYRKLGDYLLTRAERPDLAAANFRWLAAIDPDGPHVYCSLAKALALQNEVAEARQVAALALKTEPDCALAHNIQGILLISDQRINQGLPHLERACQLAPNEPAYARVLARAYLDTSNFAGAEHVLEGVLARSPQDAEAHYLLGWGYSRGPRTPEGVEQALSHLKEAARLQPEDAQTYSELGKLLLQTDHPREACRALEKAWRLNPRLEQVASNLILTYRSLGDDAKARAMEGQAQQLSARTDRLRALQKQAQLHPNDPDIALESAKLELEDGNLTDAVRYVQGVLQIRQADRRALELLERIYTVGGKPDMAEMVRQHLRQLPGRAP
jgi:Flp pilus assembly protein TadD